MDSRNSFTLLKNKLPDLPNESAACLKNASSYIKDMRCLKNIINEYLVFKEIVDNKSDKIKLIALVFYKNTYALDYSFIEKKKGLLYSFIHDYRNRKLHNSVFDKLEVKLSEITAEIINIQEERDYFPEEIRREIIHGVISKEMSVNMYFCKKLNHYTFAPLSMDDIIETKFLLSISFLKVKYSLAVRCINIIISILSA